MKKRIALILASTILLCGCANQSAEAKPGSTNDKKEVTLTAISNIKKEKCCICGKSDISMMEYYRGMDTIGIVHLDSMNMFNSEVRSYDDSGKEIFDSPGMKMNGLSEGEAHVSISGDPNRGISDIDIDYGDDSRIDLKDLEKKLCQDCLDKVCEQATEAANWGEGEELNDIWLINFKTEEFRALPGYYTMFMMDDYYIHIDHNDGKDNVLIFYAPAKTES